MEQIITEWFNTGKYGPSPSDTINKLVNMIDVDLEKFEFDFEIDTILIKHKLATALCVLYRLKMEGQPLVLHFPKKHFYPKNWNNELEITWIDYLENYYFTTEYWEMLWEDIGSSDWDSDIFNWKEQLQALIPCYINRDLRKMITDEAHSDDDRSDEELLYPNGEDLS
jgi:hypothetical protein